MSSDAYAPDPKLKFTFGLWTVGNIGRDPFGGPVREPITPAANLRHGRRVGAYGINFHDNDLIPIDATPEQADQIKKDFKKALKNNGLVVPMATTNLFTDAAFKDGAFTSNNAKIRAYAIQKTMRAMDLGAEFGAKTYVFWGGREGVESDATKNPVEAIKRFREAINFLCEYSIEQEVRLPLRLRSQAQRAARPYVFRRHRQLSRLYPDARSSRDVRRESRSRPRTHGGPEFRPPGRRGIGSRQAVSHRFERPGIRPLRSGFPLRPGQPQARIFPREAVGRLQVQRPAPVRRPCHAHRAITKT